MKRYRETDALLHDLALRKKVIRQRLDDFRAVPAEEYFFELVYCLLTPQSSARNADDAVTRLKEAGFPGQDVDLAAILRRPDRYIRFHNTKAKRLREAEAKFPELAEQLAKNSRRPDFRTACGPAVREWLVQNMRGLGWKEASHFLRNIGYRDLAILDRHILKNLRRYGVIRAVPTSLTPRRYLRIEQAFKRFAQDLDTTMDELDLLFWSRETGVLLK
jgi:N-glycosylase/DNA lyase